MTTIIKANVGKYAFVMCHGTGALLEQSKN